MKSTDLIAIFISLIFGAFAIWIIYELSVFIIDNIVPIAITALVALLVVVGVAMAFNRGT